MNPQPYVSTSHPSSNLVCHASSASSLSSSAIDNGDELKKLLKKYGFGNRLVSLKNADLVECPLPAEIYEGGKWKLSLIVGLKPPSSWPLISDGIEKPPLLDVLVMDDDGLLQERKVVDIGM